MTVSTSFVVCLVLERWFVSSLEAPINGAFKDSFRHENRGEGA